jgi:Xylose isomerase-like TIM barrel
MKRREFLMGAVAAAGLAATRQVLAQKSSDQAKLARVAIMSLGFGSILKNANQPDGPARTLDIMDIGEMYADRYGVHNVELQHTHVPSVDEAWLKEFRARLAKTKSRVTNINLEFGPMNISAPEPVQRLQAIDLTRAWIDHAVVLGSPRIMVNQGAPSEENKQVAIAALKAMGDYGKSKNIMVAMENRGGGGARGAAPGAAPATGAGAAAAPAQATPAPAQTAPAAVPSGPPAYELLVEIIKGSGTYANCDLGNFPSQEIQHAGIRAMFPLTDGNCHVKLNPARYDLAAAIALTRELKYSGIYSIEAGGGMGPDPYENNQKIYDVLIANL